MDIQTSKEIARCLIEKYKKSPSDNDNIRYKEIVKQKLLNCDELIYAINNEELLAQKASMDQYFNVNIKPYLTVPETQHAVKTYILYDVCFSEKPQYNDFLKYAQLQFMIMCPTENIIDKYTGIARHDLIAAILQEEINWSNAFGTVMKLVNDVATVTDTTYATRTLIFEQTAPSGLTKNSIKISSKVNP